MCGRFYLVDGYIVIGNIFNAVTPDKLASYSKLLREHFFNAAPTQILPIIRNLSSRRIEGAKWGLVSSFSKEGKSMFNTINLRVESIEEKPYFLKLAKTNRCIIPVNGFYEWKKLGREKQAYAIHKEDKKVFGLAGLYDIWKDSQGNELLTFTIITTPPNELMKPIHDRMPAILEESNYETWLDPNPLDLLDIVRILVPYYGKLIATPISSLVNSPENDSEAVLKPVAQFQSTLI